MRTRSLFVVAAFMLAMSTNVSAQTPDPPTGDEEEEEEDEEEKEPAPTPETETEYVEECLQDANCLKKLLEKDAFGSDEVLETCFQNSDCKKLLVKELDSCAKDDPSCRTPQLLSLMARLPRKNADGTYSCDGFGLLAPLFGISNRGIDPTNPNKRNRLRLTGPVESGIGGGYYWPFRCQEQWTAGLSVFGFSEGLNPNTTFQMGAGIGVQLTAVGKFSFGIAVGLDLVRHEVREQGGVERSYDNGLLIMNDVVGCSGNGQDSFECMGRNFTWLLTFSVTNGETPEEK